MTSENVEDYEKLSSMHLEDFDGLILDILLRVIISTGGS